MLVMRGSGLVQGADGMARQRHTVEENINKLKEAEVGLAPALAVPEDSRKLSVTEQTRIRPKAKMDLGYVLKHHAACVRCRYAVQ